MLLKFWCIFNVSYLPTANTVNGWEGYFRVSYWRDIKGIELQGTNNYPLNNPNVNRCQLTTPAMEGTGSILRVFLLCLTYALCVVNIYEDRGDKTVQRSMRMCQTVQDLSRFDWYRKPYCRPKSICCLGEVWYFYKYMRIFRAYIEFIVACKGPNTDWRMP